MTLFSSYHIPSGHRFKKVYNSYYDYSWFAITLEEVIAAFGGPIENTSNPKVVSTVTSYLCLVQGREKSFGLESWLESYKVKDPKLTLDWSYLLRELYVDAEI